MKKFSIFKATAVEMCEICNDSEAELDCVYCNRLICSDCYSSEFDMCTVCTKNQFNYNDV